jgi:predicted transcriptional regulator
MTTISLFRVNRHEGRVLSLLWRFEELTANDMVHLFDDARMTREFVTTNLDKLHSKKLVTYRRIHGTHYYRASIDRHTFVSLLQQQLSDFLGVDGANMVSSILGDNTSVGNQTRNVTANSN